jgi:hypothetical protein
MVDKESLLVGHVCPPQGRVLHSSPRGAVNWGGGGVLRGTDGSTVMLKLPLLVWI